MRSEQFTKVFDTKFGEVTVLKDTNDGDPAISVHINPDGNRITGTMTFEGSEEGKAQRDIGWQTLTIDAIEYYVEEQLWVIATDILEKID